MKQILFENFTDEQRIQMLEDNCDAVVTEDEKEFKRQIKERKQPLLDEKQRLLDEIKMNGLYVEGRVFKFIDREAKEVGLYDEDGYLVEQRRMTSLTVRPPSASPPAQTNNINHQY